MRNMVLSCTSCPKGQVATCPQKLRRLFSVRYRREEQVEIWVFWQTDCSIHQVSLVPERSVCRVCTQLRRKKEMRKVLFVTMLAAILALGFAGSAKADSITIAGVEFDATVTSTTVTVTVTCTDPSCVN